MLFKFAEIAEFPRNRCGTNLPLSEHKNVAHELRNGAALAHVS